MTAAKGNRKAKIDKKFMTIWPLAQLPRFTNSVPKAISYPKNDESELDTII